MKSCYTCLVYRPGKPCHLRMYNTDGMCWQHTKTYWHYTCPECGNQGQASTDCTLAACPKCNRIIRP